MFSFCQIEILTPFHSGKKEFLILFHYAGPFFFTIILKLFLVTKTAKEINWFWFWEWIIAISEVHDTIQLRIPLLIIIQSLISQRNSHFRTLSLLHCKASKDCMVLPWPREGLESQRLRRIRASSEVLILSQSIFNRTLKQIMNKHYREASVSAIWLEAGWIW